MNLIEHLKTVTYHDSTLIELRLSDNSISVIIEEEYSKPLTSIQFENTTDIVMGDFQNYDIFDISTVEYKFNDGKYNAKFVINLGFGKAVWIFSFNFKDAKIQKAKA